MMELRQLHYLATVARQRHFGRASRMLRVAQPALSGSVQKLYESAPKRGSPRFLVQLTRTVANKLLIYRGKARVTAFRRARDRA